MSNETTQSLIVVGVDGSEPAKRASLGTRGGQASRHEALRRHCLARPRLRARRSGVRPILSTSVDAAIREAAEAIANEAVEQARAAGLDAEAIITNGQAADVLIESAEGASLLVVGSRTRRVRRPSTRVCHSRRASTTPPALLRSFAEP